MYDIQRDETMNFILDDMESSQYDSGYYSPSEDFNFDTVIHFELDTGSGIYYSQDFRISHNVDDGAVRTDISVNAQHGIKSNSDSYKNPEMLDKMTRKRNFISELISKMFMMPDFGKRINPQLLEKFVRKSLEEKGIHTPFEFSVTKWNNQLAYKSDGYKVDKKTRYYTIRLFPEDIFDDTSYLSLFFPNRTNFIIRSLGFMGVSSSILTIFLLFAFSLTLYIVFKQKRLTDMKSDFVNNLKKKSYSFKKEEA